MRHVLLVMSNMLFVLWLLGVLFVLWIIGMEAQLGDAAGAGRTGHDLLDRGRSTASATAAPTNGSARRGRCNTPLVGCHPSHGAPRCPSRLSETTARREEYEYGCANGCDECTDLQYK